MAVSLLMVGKIADIPIANQWNLGRNDPIYQQLAKELGHPTSLMPMNFHEMWTF